MDDRPLNFQYKKGTGLEKPEARQVLREAPGYDDVQLYEGDGLMIMPDSKEFNFKCCKCGLVHRIEIEHADEGTILRFFEES
jgi:hypothetical protein